MRPLSYFIIASTLLIAASAQAQIPPQSLNSASTTPDFIKAAATSDLFEVEEGKLAAERGADPRVRSFGQQMVQAHTQTTVALKRAIAQAGLPEPPQPTLDPGQRIEVDNLRTMKGADFDHEYLLQQAGAHHAALLAMQTYAAQGDTPPLRQAARTTAPLVAQHLSAVLALQQSEH